MENNKKTMLALGFSLAIMGGGASYTVLAMEQPCKISPEIVEYHKLVAQEMQSLPTPASRRLEMSPVISPDFLKGHPLNMLYHLQYAMDWLHIHINQTQSVGKGKIPGTLSNWAYEQNEADGALSKKVRHLFDLIKDSCDITDEQIDKIRNALKAMWAEEPVARLWSPYNR